MFQFSSLKCLYHSQLLLELGMLCPGTLCVLHFQASQTPLRWQHDLDGACLCINLWGTAQEGLEPSVCAGTGSFHSRIPPSNPGGCACLAAGAPEYPGGAAVPDPDYGPDLHNLRGRATFCVSLYILLLIHLLPCIQKSQTLAAVSWVGWEDAGLPRGGALRIHSGLGRSCAGQRCFVFLGRVGCRWRWWELKHRATFPPSSEFCGSQSILPLPAHYSTLPATSGGLQREIFPLRFLHL